MSLKIGQINRLKVVRKTNIAYVLKDRNDEEVFLHINESNHQILNPDAHVDAFLYVDGKGRMAATLHTPYLTIDKPDFLEVVDRKDGLGVFLDMGISKDLLLSNDYLPNQILQWPEIGDRLLVELRIKDKMTARPVPYHELENAEEPLEVGSEVTGHIQVISKIGLFVLTESKHVVLIKTSQYRDIYRLGQLVTVNITYKTAKGYEGSLIKAKEEIRKDDAQMIVDYLKANQGKMSYTADTDSEKVMQVFGLSRKAFKRALGLLYKKRKVDFVDGKTIWLGE